MTRLFKDDVLLASYQIAGGAETRLYMRRRTRRFVLWQRTSAGDQRGYNVTSADELPRFLEHVKAYDGTIHDSDAMKEALAMNSENSARRNQSR
jgi:hypothetical protein